MWYRAVWPMLIPAAFALGLRHHLSHPWLPAWFGDLPYAESIVVQYVIWSFYCLFAARFRRDALVITCPSCRCSATLAKWREQRHCPWCRHQAFRPVRQRLRRPIAVTVEAPVHLAADAQRRVHRRLASVGHKLAA